MWIIAHRGGGELFPENTLTAFQQSEQLGVDMVECDVHVSRDGQLMVIHDSTLTRTGGTSIQVNELSAQELGQIDVGDGQGVPTLIALLDAIQIPVVVEIKTVDVVPGIFALLTERPDLISRLIPISFYHAAVQSLVDHTPGLQGGVLLAGIPINLARVAQDAHVRLLSLEHQMVNRALVEAMHDENLLVSVWTPNTPDEIHAMIEAGVDGIASDRPDWVINAVNSQ